MKIKTSKLKGAALDWAVVIAKGVPPSDIYLTRGRIYRRTRDYETGELVGRYETGPEFLPSKMWEAGGPIIEREGICLLAFGLGETAWAASMSSGPTASRRVSGPSPLIAAMRCYVASKMGDEVDVPEGIR